ncbi:MAG: 5'/3'-nucleotidase SurE [Candidatus Hodarchaeales archaeon]
MVYEILLTNDDGITSSGLMAVLNILKEQDFSITVVAPTTKQSAMGCSHSHGDRWVKWQKKTKENIDWYSVDSSPATCISVALRELDLKPDLVVSGINYGENLGLNVFYSGTVGAAWEAAMSGHLALAVSLELPANMHFQLDESIDFSIPALFTKKVIKQLLKDKPNSLLWNLNIPNQATKKTQIKKSIVARDRWNFPVIRESKKESKNTGQVRFEFDPTHQHFATSSDVYLLRQGYVTLTPIDNLILPWVES